MKIFNINSRIQTSIILFIFIFIFSHGITEAATLYVSLAESNGYVVGNDSNNGLSKSAPKLTIGSAVTAATAGDTIMLNDGTYDYTTGVLNINKGISLQSENDYGATIINNGGVAYMFGLQAGITGTMTLGKIILTERAANTRILYVFAPTTKYSLILDGTKFLDYNKTAVYVGNSNTDIDLTIQNSIFDSSVMQSGGNYYVIDATGVRNGNISINNNTITNSLAVSANARGGIAITKIGSDTATVSITNNTIVDKITAGTLEIINLNTYGLANTTFLISNNHLYATSTGGTTYGIRARSSITTITSPTVSGNTVMFDGGSSGVMYAIFGENSNAIITGNDIDLTATNVTLGGILADVLIALTCNNMQIYSNTINISNSGGYGILVGGESTGLRATYLTSPKVYSNTIVFNESVSNTGHGLMFGYIQNGLGWKNYSSGSSILYLIKGSTNSIFHHNLAINPTSSAPTANAQSLRLKGANNGSFINNTVSNLDAARADYDTSFYADQDTAPASGLFRNNLTYSAKNLFADSYVTDTSTVEFFNNSYYRTNLAFSNFYNGTWYNLANWTTNFENGIQSSNPLFRNINTSYELGSLSPLIDSGSNTGVVTDYGDYLGNPLYGTPDIGAYEYQPPYTLGTHDIDPTGDIRIYGDGKYRYTTATSSTETVDLDINPPEGRWSYAASTTRPEWLNIVDITWTNDLKQWTASSTTATTTVYTIGDLTPNTYYTMAVDGLASTTQQANSSGVITYTYSGGYSAHTFSVTPDTTGPASFSLISPTNGASVSPNLSFSWNSASDSGSGLSHYRLYIDGVIHTDNILNTSAEATNLSCGTHTWYVRAIDNQNNSTDSSTNNFTVDCGSGGGSSVASRIKNLKAMGNYKLAQELEKQYSFVPFEKSSTSTNYFKRNLKVGSTGEDVRQLQIFLNNNGFTVSNNGLGSRGQETSYFGLLTRSAVIRFQETYAKDILKPLNLSRGTGIVAEKTINKINTLY